MSETESSVRVPFTPNSNLTNGLIVSAALGGGPSHALLVDTGSVGILIPRRVLGPAYQDFDPSQDIAFGYVSSGNHYLGQWVNAPIFLGVPPGWDGTGDYPFAQVEIFAVDQPADFDGGVLGIGFAIGGLADGGPARNPLLQLYFQGQPLSPGYILTSGGIDAGLTTLNTAGFTFIPLERDASGEDWRQPLGCFSLSGTISLEGPTDGLPILIDTGIDYMILWLDALNTQLNTPSGTAFPAGVSVTLSMPPLDQTPDSVLQYSFVTGDTNDPVAPSYVEWRRGFGINTGRNVLAFADYLYDAASGRIGFRIPVAP
jgi:hypothetical protein